MASGCRFTFGDKRLTLDVAQLEALLTIARDEGGEVAVSGFVYDCDVEVSGDVRVDGGRWVQRNGAVVSTRASRAAGR